MAILRLRKNIGYGSANTLNDQKLYISPHCYWVKEALVEAGWVVYRSSNGDTASDSDLWSTEDFFTVGLQPYNASGPSTSETTDGIWVCLRSPNTDANGDYVHICLSPRCAPWKNLSDPGPTNDDEYTVDSTVGTSYASYQSGSKSACMLLGVTLSDGLTAFTGGTPAVTGDISTVLGSLPVNANAVWSMHNLGSSYAGSEHTGMVSLVTEDNQFWVIQHSATEGFVSGYRQIWGIASLDDGGYVVLEPKTYDSENFWKNFCSGYFYQKETDGPGTANRWRRWDTEMGGFRSVWVKNVSGTVENGPLADPMPSGWETFVQGEEINNTVAWPNAIRLHAYNAASQENWYLGKISDFIMIGQLFVDDTDRIRDNTLNKCWYVCKDELAFFVKWDMDDNPNILNEVTPGA